MLELQKQKIVTLIKTALEPIIANSNLIPVVLLERPRNPAHGDISCNVAMQLAQSLKKDPHSIAQALVTSMMAKADRSGLVETAEVAHPGFINMWLSKTSKQDVIRVILEELSGYGRSNFGLGKKVLVEFVSANPTGPLHVGHGRQGVLGDTLAALFKIKGFSVSREFYYNDAGGQIDTLANSVLARARGFNPGDKDWPSAAYNGDYIADIAKDFLEKNTDAVGSTDADAACKFAISYLRREQDLDLLALGISFDRYYLESSLYDDGKVSKIVDSLRNSGVTYEMDGALWLRTTDYGDDKDRVMKKSDGSYTYFVPDIAYHVTKWSRGFSRAINIQGSDHYGTTTRVRAGLQALNLGIPKDYPEYVLHKMVKVIKNSREVKISKRAGSYVTLRDLIEWASSKTSDPTDTICSKSIKLDQDLTSGRDAVRFFLLSRKADSEFVFDIDLALTRSDENPVYYIQYAHARICSLLKKWGGDESSLAKADLRPLGSSSREASLMVKLGEYPEMLSHALGDLAPHQIGFYLQGLAGNLHSYYNAERVLSDDKLLEVARLALLCATRQVLRNGLALIGVSAPAHM